MGQKINKRAKNKTVFVQIRVTPEQKAELKKLADDKSISITDLIISAVSRVRPWKDKAVEKRRNMELARIGNNLNQISIWCHNHQSTIDVTKIDKRLVSIERTLECI